MRKEELYISVLAREPSLDTFPFFREAANCLWDPRHNYFSCPGAFLDIYLPSPPTEAPFLCKVKGWNPNTTVALGATADQCGDDRMVSFDTPYLVDTDSGFAGLSPYRYVFIFSRRPIDPLAVLRRAGVQQASSYSEASRILQSCSL